VDLVETRLDGPKLFVPARFGDARGFFAETFRAEWLPGEDFVQDNHSRSRRGTVRGMHFQTAPGQGKLVRCARGAILDVVVDLRRASPTFGGWESFTLDDADLRIVWVPVGFAHGFAVLSEEADVTYKVTSYFDPATEAGFAYDDPAVGIEWPDGERLVSERDRSAPALAAIADSLPW
jgi:dTDP-4-dehydrorhamnose 3,5-epimerase